MRTDGHTVEEHLGPLIVNGQRHEVWVRSAPDEDGSWHNALVFRRDGVLSSAPGSVTGVEWQVPPGIALQRARELSEKDRLDLYRRALRPRPPVL